MNNNDNTTTWQSRGKSVRQLIKELQSFDDHDIEVYISIDGGSTLKCISLVGKVQKSGAHACCLMNCEKILVNRECQKLSDYPPNKVMHRTPGRTHFQLCQRHLPGSGDLGRWADGQKAYR